MGTYSFLNVQGTISGPSGSCSIGNGAGLGAEGITVSLVDENVTTVYGADGTVMHSVHASVGSRVTIRFLKTSPTNAILDKMYRGDRASSANAGQNVLTLGDNTRGDSIIGTQMAFARRPDVSYAVEGGTNEWIFNGPVKMIFGAGTPG